MGRLWGFGYDKGPFYAERVTVDTSNFSGNLSVLDDNVQAALEALDQLTIDASYTNPEPSVIEVGGISVGTTFSNTSFGDFVDMLLYPELFGTLTNPSQTFASTITGFREIGETLSLTLSFTFNRGSINPQYESDSEFRSGLPNRYQYQYNNSDIHNDYTDNMSSSHSVIDHEVGQGNQTWRGRTHYDAGVQPKGSKGTDFDAPLEAGETSYISRTITGVYPYFATTSNITTMTKQALASMTSTYVQTNMVAESGSDKQTCDFPDEWANITGIQFFNTVSNAWEWINGSKANSLLTFDTSATQHNVQGTDIDYTRFTHNGSLIGARMLRWYSN